MLSELFHLENKYLNTYQSVNGWALLSNTLSQGLYQSTTEPTSAQKPSGSSNDRRYASS